MFLVLKLIRKLLLSLTTFIFILSNPTGADPQSKYFKRAVSDYQIKFPKDHGEHKNFKVEWWYVTANLSSEIFGELGVQWTLFKNELAQNNKKTSWDLSSFWMAHSALTTKKHHFYEERFARKNIGLAGVTLSPFKAWIDNWSASGDNKLKKLTIESNGKNFSYKLELETQFSPVLQGKNGFSLKSTTGNASHYYSQPFYSVKGWVEINGIKDKVEGLGWLDREWSSDLLGENQIGWDWFSIHLENGNKLMIFQVRERDGNNFVSGSWIDKDGSKQALSAKEVRITKLKSKSYIWGKIPVKWKVDIPEKAVYLTITPLNENSLMGTLIPYWEGPVKLSGSDKGVGYLEMTGYKQYRN